MSWTALDTGARRRRTALLAAGLIGALLASLACGDGGVPAPTTPPQTTPTATATRSPAPQITPSPGGSFPSIDLATTAALATIYGADSGDFLSDIPGLATGDFNDDGFDDILVGARFGDGPANGREDAGEAYVIFGTEALPSAVDIAAGEQDLTIYGEGEGSNLGFSAAAGDVNGDGIDDILVGAPFAPGRAGTGGAVHIVFGDRDLAGTIDIASGQQDLTITGPGGSDLFGDSLAIGDVNGDGGDDIIIGSTFATDRDRGTGLVGAVYVVLGSTTLAGTISTALEEQDVTIFGAEEFDELGDTVASGDVNGDGIDDIIATAEAADGPDNGRPVAAEVHVIFGTPDLGGTLRISEGDQDVSIYGAEAHDTLGFSLASGDLNGDDMDDIIMGAHLADGPTNSREQGGEVYIVFGSTNLPSTIDIGQDQQDLTVFGADRSDLFGASVAVADVDGDGSAEAILGTGSAAGAANGRLNSGEAYLMEPLLPGSPLDIAAGGGVRIAIFGAEPGDGLGSSLASGDLNGDGRQEIVIMAARAPGLTGTPQAGRLYVVSIDQDM